MVSDQVCKGGVEDVQTAAVVLPSPLWPLHGDVHDHGAETGFDSIPLLLQTAGFSLVSIAQYVTDWSMFLKMYPNRTFHVPKGAHDDFLGGVLSLEFLHYWRRLVFRLHALSFAFQLRVMDVIFKLPLRFDLPSYLHHAL